MTLLGSSKLCSKFEPKKDCRLLQQEHQALWKCVRETILQLELSTLKKPYEKAGIDENGAKDVDMRI